MKSKEVFCHLTLNKDGDTENVKLNEKNISFKFVAIFISDTIIFKLKQ